MGLYCQGLCGNVKYYGSTAAYLVSNERVKKNFRVETERSH